jgi:hypothetical protein
MRMVIKLLHLSLIQFMKWLVVLVGVQVVRRFVFIWTVLFQKADLHEGS